jgi:diaminopimelate epimerase
VTRNLSFSKYQAAGNDFLVIHELDDDGPVMKPDDVPALCDRWFGAGADGVIRVGRGAAAPFSMDLTNADGSPAQMSGNGIRCVAAFLYDRGLTHGDSVRIETGAGIRDVRFVVDTSGVTSASVAMGVPNFTKAGIPMRGPAWETFLAQPLELGGGLRAVASAVGMGNPHLVLFLDEDPERYHVEHLGPALERHEWFPERTNVEFARIVDQETIEARVWERGVGETLACGTGACAAAVAANEAGPTGRSVKVRFRGGVLEVERHENGEVILAGPVAHVFDGTLDLDGL